MIEATPMSLKDDLMGTLRVSVALRGPMGVLGALSYERSCQENLCHILKDPLRSRKVDIRDV